MQFSFPPKDYDNVNVNAVGIIMVIVCCDDDDDDGMLVVC